MSKQYKKKSMRPLTTCNSEDQMDRPDPLGFIAKENAKIAELMQEKDANGKLKHPHLKEYLNYIQPKRSDCLRVFTESELKELCLRIKCRVRMELCNPCEDYSRRLYSEGRLQNRSREYINKLLIKAVMRHKAVALYTQEDINNHRLYQWPFRLRYNILNLNLWKHERAESDKNVVENLVGDDVSDEESPDSYVNSEALNEMIVYESEVSNVGTQALNEMIANESEVPNVAFQALDEIIADESEVPNVDSQALYEIIADESEVSNVNTQALNEMIAYESEVPNVASQALDEIIADESEVPNVNTQALNEMIANNSESFNVDSQALSQMVDNESEVIVINEPLVNSEPLDERDNVQPEVVNEILRGEEVHNSGENYKIPQDDHVYSEAPIEASFDESDLISVSQLEQFSSKFSTENGNVTVPNNSDLIKGAYEVNTESMTIDEQSYLQSEAEGFSEPIPYELFNTQIPLTSTQSQSQSQGKQ